jgi:multiple sugar transport system substrate-binding protein
MSEEKKVSRRGYVKYAGAGIVIVAGAAAGAYYASRPGPTPPKPTETTTTEMMTETVTTGLPLVDQVPTFPKDIYKGVGIVVETEAGLQEEQFYYYGKQFTDQTGCGITVSPIPVGTTYEKLWAEFIAGTHAYDIVFVPPYWCGDLVPGGYLMQLDDYFKAKDPWLDDILPAFKDRYMKWGGHYYGVTSDGDVFNMYYRKDLFADSSVRSDYMGKYGEDLRPPRTWDEYAQVSSFFTERGGGDSWGSAEDCVKGEATWWFINRFGPMGGRFFNPDTMEPEINSPAGVKALENQIECVKSSPSGNLEWDCTLMRNTFYQGNLAMFIDWPDPAIEVEDPKMSKVTGDKTGFGLIPGSENVYNNDEKTWVKADDLPSEIKKDHVFDGVYHSASLGYGCILAVAATSKNTDAAYDFIRYFTSPKISLEVVSDEYVLSGLDPYRYSQINSDYLRNRTPGYKDFLAIEEQNILSGYPDLRIRGAEAFYDVLQTYQLQALAGQISAKQAVDSMAKDWSDTVNRLGRDDLLKQWQASPHTPYGP